jgi:hypothetical protein
MSSILFENAHVSVSALAGEPILLVVRKPTRMELSELDGVWGAADRALAAIDRRRSCLLVDVREASGRNDEQFEHAFAPFRQRLCSDWLEVALVVSTVPGKFQVQRYAREDAARVSVFDEREAALAALRRAVPRK